MNNKGNIKLAISNGRYEVKFKYATPLKIDLFSLIIMEIISKGERFKKDKVKDVLKLMEIPEDLHNLFGSRLFELIQNKTILSPVEIEKKDIQLHYIPYLLDHCPKDYSLTDLGLEAFKSKELIEEPKEVTKDYVYEVAYGRLTEYDKVRKQSPEDAIELDLSEVMDERSVFSRIIGVNTLQYVPGSNEKTKIFDLEGYQIENVGCSDLIEVRVDNGKINFFHRNKKIIDAFLSNSEAEKNSIKNKMFFYPDIPNTHVNIDKARIASKRDKYKMKAVFGNRKAIEALVESECEPFYLGEKEQTKNGGDFGFCFAGLTAEGRSMVYKYEEISECGYTIPLEEIDNSVAVYEEIFAGFKDSFKEKLWKSPEEYTHFLLQASPHAQKSAVIKELLANDNDIEVMIEHARGIRRVVGEDQGIKFVISDFLIDRIEKELKRKNITIRKIVKIHNEFSLPKDRLIKLIAENMPHSEEVINNSLVLGENLTIQHFRLPELYNKLLEEGTLEKVSHNSNLYADFRNYDMQYKKLRDFGVIDYYHYPIKQKDWDGFMKEVYLLKRTFDKVQVHLWEKTKKAASDFFERIDDDYYINAPIDEKSYKELLTGGDRLKTITEIINSKKKYDSVVVAGAIRSLYEEYLRDAERKKDKIGSERRGGKELIQYVFGKDSDEVYRNWRNLCTLVHKETSGDKPLWKGSEKDRQKALMEAVSCYRKKFIERDGRK